jgi:hypothetical protein
MEKKLEMEVKQLSTGINSALKLTQQRIDELDKLFCANHSFHDGQTFKTHIEGSKILTDHDVVWTSNREAGPDWVFGVRRAACVTGFDTRCASLSEQHIHEVLPAIERLIIAMLAAARLRQDTLNRSAAAAQKLLNLPA